MSTPPIPPTDTVAKGPIVLTNGLSNGHWKQAVKSSVSVALGIVLAEMATGDLSTPSGVKHTLWIILITTITAEARYWQKRLADSEGV